MLIGKKVGLLSAVIGTSIGVYYALSPVINNLSNGSITGHTAGIETAAIATIVGLSLAFIGTISNKST
ncbi:MAG: hypothetical protein WBC60_09990 [Cognaticolwellia sp.]